MYKKLSWKIVMDSSMETVKIIAMVFAILVGATAFSLIFVYTGADLLVEDFMLGLPCEKWDSPILSMLTIMLLGFCIDFIKFATS